MINQEEMNEIENLMEEELERVHPTYPNFDFPASAATTSDGRVVPVSDRDLERVEAFSEEFDEELQGEDNRKMMFILDISVHVGETPDQLRTLIDEAGIEPVYTARMAIHLAAKEMGVTYQEAGKIIGDQIYGTEKGTRLQ
jgi:hypothetical protein